MWWIWLDINFRIFLSFACTSDLSLLKKPSPERLVIFLFYEVSTVQDVFKSLDTYGIHPLSSVPWRNTGQLKKISYPWMNFYGNPSSLMTWKWSPKFVPFIKKVRVDQFFAKILVRPFSISKQLYFYNIRIWRGFKIFFFPERPFFHAMIDIYLNFSRHFVDMIYEIVISISLIISPRSYYSINF